MNFCVIIQAFAGGDVGSFRNEKQICRERSPRKIPVPARWGWFCDTCLANGDRGCNLYSPDHVLDINCILPGLPEPSPPTFFDANLSQKQNIRAHGLSSIMCADEFSIIQSIPSGIIKYSVTLPFSGGGGRRPRRKPRGAGG